MRRLFIYCFSLIALSVLPSCMEDYLDLYPEDKITSANFPEGESDIKLLLDGVYSQLREKEIYNQGLFGFGITDGATPNAFNWGTGEVFNKLGAGRLSSSDEGVVTFRWKRCYEIISRANYLLTCLEQVDLADDVKAVYSGEAHFLRGVAYSVLAETYGGVPIILSEISTEEARQLKRASVEETWQQAEDDYDVAIANLDVDAPELGRATKGAALGMKMRACLYQGKYEEVLTLVDEIDALKKYKLFHSYEGLFDPANENNEEVLFDIQYIEGENSQGTYLDQYCGTGTGTWQRGSRYVPTDDLVAAYETIDGSPIDPENPYEFEVPERLKELYQQKDYGPYAEKGVMHVNFLTNNDITGGNSGSPVMNARGELIGLAFDGNWEAMSGDTVFELELQRTICVDIRYVLFVIDKFAGDSRLIDEMTIVR